MNEPNADLRRSSTRSETLIVCGGSEQQRLIVTVAALGPLPIIEVTVNATSRGSTRACHGNSAADIRCRKSVTVVRRPTFEYGRSRRWGLSVGDLPFVPSFVTAVT